jgi:hypothetical protein
MTIDAQSLLSGPVPGVEKADSATVVDRRETPEQRIGRLEREIESAEDYLAAVFLRTVQLALIGLLLLSAGVVWLEFSGPPYMPHLEEMISLPGILGLVWVLVPLAILGHNWFRRAGIRRLEDDLDKAKREASERCPYLEAKLHDLQERHNTAVIWLLIVSFGFLIFELFELISFDQNLYRAVARMFPDSPVQMNPILILTPILWVLTAILGVAIYYFHYHLPLKMTRQKLASRYDWVRRQRERDPEERQNMLQEQVHIMTTSIASVFLGNAERFKLANRWREQADDILESSAQHMRDDPSSKPLEISLGDAETLIGQINELILREKNELQQHRRWRVFAVVIMLIYILLPVIVILRFPEAASKDKIIPVFGIPLSVVMWGAMGSLGAILYRFYTERGRVRLDLELRWLIARPIIGVIMGGLAYLAIVSGLTLLNTGNIPNSVAVTDDKLPQNLNVFWVIAFLAGFSDKFYVGFIKLLVGRTLGAPDNGEPPTSQPEPEKDQAIPEAMKEEIIPKTRHNGQSPPRRLTRGKSGARSSKK